MHAFIERALLRHICLYANFKISSTEGGLKSHVSIMLKEKDKTIHVDRLMP